MDFRECQLEVVRNLKCNEFALILYNIKPYIYRHITYKGLLVSSWYIMVEW